MLDNRILKTIQSGTMKEMYVAVNEGALYMAMGGFLPQANSLLAELYSYKLTHDRTTWLSDWAFTMLWHASGDKPKFIPFEITDIDKLERDHRGYVTAPRRLSYQFEKKDWTEIKIIDLVAMAHATVTLKKANESSEDVLDGTKSLEQIISKRFQILESDTFPSADEELLALQMLNKYLTEFNSNNEALSLAAELAARNNKTHEAIAFIKRWAKNIENSSSISISIMVSNRHVAPLLLKGIIADELHISENICNEFFKSAKKVLTERMQNGRSLVYGNLSWDQLIKKLCTVALEYAPEDFPTEVVTSKWIGFEKAKPSAIKATEKRLGLQLPEDYKLFLRVTNGLLAFPLLNPQLLPVEEIDYLKNVERPDIFEIYKDYSMKDDDGETFYEIVSRCILISIYPEEQMVWLVPPKEKGGEWQTWFFGAWVPGEVRYPGFRYFIEDHTGNG